ncbi:phosphoribosylglycinamide formyltransferase [Mesoterricola silvestris]|uniref:phosphoribosylglycinamide formyltransferase 1 n=1 Tax=Mesoterricola silvestris TaxID=2927979 RepID=A0AA48GXY9_9BACT|nr:phosphoribosylglycinamide formyltransferase [Mesoterricola silvestris]BDU72418.1 phosphoribosylglycinamide formyltransferase [Mesoterricola silvestris]
MKRLALFISGTGGNALNLLEACASGRVPATPVLGLSSSARAAGVERLAARGLGVAVVARSAFDDDRAFTLACLDRAEAAGADVIALCGWLKKLDLPAAWEGRILNIHPGLLPAFGGPGMYGMHVHRAVLEAGVAESGCTVHVVDNVYDHGRIVAQARVPVLPGDTPEALQQRVYQQEMALYPAALRDFLASL